MKKEINTHGIEIDLKSLIEVSKETRNITNATRYRLEISYIIDTGEFFPL